MNVLRKIAKWCWDKKERTILVIMLAILGYNIYKIVKVVDADSMAIMQPPGNGPYEGFGPPPRIERSIEDVDILPLIRRSIHHYVPPGRGTGNNDQDGEGQDLKALRIFKGKDGAYKAQISAGGKKTILAEGEQFESYQLVSINADPDGEPPYCIIYSENTNSKIKVEIK